MNDEEIMRNFNESLQEKPKETITPYHATTNLNTAISNPNMNVNNTLDVNIQTPQMTASDLMKPENGIDNNNYTEPLNNQVGNNPPNVNPEPTINESPAPVPPQNSYHPDVTEQYVQTTPPQEDQVHRTTTYISAQPQIRTVKKKKTLKITPEIKATLVIALILFIFVLIMPTIYDFIRELRMHG